MQREATERAGLAIGDWLMGLNIQRPINSLTRDELAAMAAAAIGTWCIARSEQAEQLGAAQHDEPLYQLAG